VVKLGSGEAVKSAIVRLKRVDDDKQGYKSIAGTDGRFALKNVEPGQYRLEVSRYGFVSQHYGQKRAEDPGATLTLSPGRVLSDLIFHLLPAAVIAGRILDEDGQPLPWVQLSAMHEVYYEGKRKLQTESIAETNDLGEYRLFGLSPGHYLVSAVFSTEGPWNMGQNFKDLGESTSDRGYLRTYYPGSTDEGKALSISVKAGEELPSIDMLLQKVGAYIIRGRVFNGPSHHSASQAFLCLQPKNSRVLWDSENNYINLQKDGTFEVHNVLAGSYTLTAFGLDEGKPLSARQSIEITNGDVDGLSLTLTPGTAIEGQLKWDGNPSIVQEELRVLASSDTIEFGGGDGRVLSNGSFTLKNVSEGSYHLEVTGLSPDCYIRNIRYGTSDASHEAFIVQPGSDASLEVTVSSRGARVQGNVTTAENLPASGVWVVLAPEAAHRSEFRLYKSIATDQHGNFELRGIAPGDYKLFSWEQIESDAWQDPDFLKTFEDKGERITVQDSDQKTVNLTAILTKSPDTTKP
jgi:hypothetical protein